jgi:(1->4)-alpha-D-glucan 1-alpha-D-glucosylmutase
VVRGMVVEVMKPRSPIPRATYRLQLNREFTFTQATEIVPYLSGIGISHCYISPCLKARAGSMHGYDIVDHNSFNPEIGSAEDFDRFVSTLHEHGMGLILDIVPNHMGVMGSDNAWWLDVLENGESSIYAGFFDIDWRPLKEELHGKVLVPVLGDHYGAVLESGDLKLVFHRERGEFDISYFEHRFPVDPREYPRVLHYCATKPAEALGEQNPDFLEFQSLITAFGHLPDRSEASADRIAERNRDKEIHKRRLAELCARAPEIASCIQRAVDSINGDSADPASFEELHELIKTQAFRLANWRVASDDINYRRFFDTNDLAGIRVENERVFQETHKFVLNLIAAGKVDGVRIDHPDGLYDPAEYFDRLNRSIATALNQSEDASESENKPRDCPYYLVIEKILTSRERLPKEWEVCGTTGYDFANLVNGLFVDRSAAKRLDRIYRYFIDDDSDFEELAYRCRKLIMRVALASELNVLANQLTRIALSKRRTCDFTLNSLRDALAEIVACFPVYRTYVTSSHVSENDQRYIRIAVAAAKWRSPAGDTSVFDFISDVLLTRIADGQDPAYQNAVTTFAMKFQQFTSPVMAKGIEDTAFYRYNRLVSLNEVGGDPHRFGITTADLHVANHDRLDAWPHTMLTTSTHDSKRSEDVRARINVLSEISGQWRLRMRDWRRFNSAHKRVVNDKPAPSPNDEYLLYQTLIGAWPQELSKANYENNHDEKRAKTFCERIESYMLKAIREAKRNTSWINRNKEYEAAVSSFVKILLTPDPNNPFLDDFIPFQRRVALVGMWNSLSQTLLKLTCPGVPDIYQGNELWDFSLVDPDNRRPVDYARRRQMFEDLRQIADSRIADNQIADNNEHSSISRLLETPEDGRLKLYLIWRTLCLRQQQPDLFEAGEYLTVAAQGAKADHVVAFARKMGSASAFVVVPRLIATLLAPWLATLREGEAISPVGGEVWEDTSLTLPSSGGTRYRNVFTGQVLNVSASINLAATLAEFPVALYVSF